MAAQRYPITRMQVMGLAWAIAIQQGKSCFSETGPSLKWWRSFRDRHPELTLRKAESIERGRVFNATGEVVEEYFEVLGKTLSDKGLHDKPHLIYNCDEAAISLNRSTVKVVVPAKNKRCHALMRGTSSHISVLCCCNAAGGTVPPLIIFSKGLPAGRKYAEDGPANATYSTSDSGFIDRDIYADWFEKNFIRHLPVERPILLLQDGATAHISPRLIDLAIANDIILLCFPPKLTHILQPCDVGIYRKMKSELSKVMHKVKMLRGDLWISKQNFPAVFKSVFENTFVPGLITESFRKCGIYPLNKGVVEQELLRDRVKVTHAKNVKCNAETPRTPPQDCLRELNPEAGETRNNDCHIKRESIPIPGVKRDEGQCLADLVIETVSPSQADPDAEVLVEAKDTTVQPCPPKLALEAIEKSLTPRKIQTYHRKYTEDVEDHRDPVFSTWRYLKKKADTEEAELPACEPNPLVKAGVIPENLATVLTPPNRTKKQTIRIGKPVGTRVLTSTEVSQAVREKELKKKADEDAKSKRKEERAKKQLFKDRKKTRERSQKRLHDRKQEMREDTKQTERDRKPDKDRLKFFRSKLGLMAKCKTFSELQNVAKQVQEKSACYKTHVCLSPATYSTIDEVSAQLLPPQCLDLTPLKVAGDGNCLPRAGSKLMFGNEAQHIEVRVRIALELALNTCYLNDSFLADGLSATQLSTTTSITRNYAMYSQTFAMGSKLSDNDIRSIYEREALSATTLCHFMGVWHLHALGSVLEAPLHVIYPGTGSVSRDLNRVIMPREKKHDRVVHIMWTHTTNTDPTSWWEPNHFVPLISLPGDDKEQASVCQDECHSVKVDAKEITLTCSPKESAKAMDIQDVGGSARLDAAFGDGHKADLADDSAKPMDAQDYGGSARLDTTFDEGGKADLSRESAKPMDIQDDGGSARLDTAFGEGGKADLSRESTKPTCMDVQDDEGSARLDAAFGDGHKADLADESAKPVDTQDDGGSARLDAAFDEGGKADLSRESAKSTRMDVQDDGGSTTLDAAFANRNKADLSNRSDKPMDEQEDEDSATPEMALDEDTAHSTNALAKPIQAPDNSARQKVASDEDILCGGTIELQSLMPGVFVSVSHGKSCLPAMVSD